MVPAQHYCIPPLERIDSDRILELIHQRKYFILHAPRQSGKTSALLALQDLLNSGSHGPYRCLYLNVEGGQTAREDVARGIGTIFNVLTERAYLTFGDDFVEKTGDWILARGRPDVALYRLLTQWAKADARPLVLLIDEIDALVGDTLLSVLRQLCSGYDQRPYDFPQSIVLCGVQSVLDYRIRSSSMRHEIAGGSAFNVSADSLRLGDFSEAEVQVLLGQHTAATGQAFSGEAIRRVWTQTRGQPWLVNALCNRICARSATASAGSRPIVEDDILAVQERLILDRVMHFEQLGKNLREDPVKRVIEPILTGAESADFSDRDIDYVRDLGLVAPDLPLRIANPIYREVVPRELTYALQQTLTHQAAWFLDGEHGLQIGKLLEAFQAYFRQHAEHWMKGSEYKEAGPQLLLHAYLQSVVDGGGHVEREYALGRGRTDLLVTWPRPKGMQRFVIECKLLRGNLESTINSGLTQTAAYIDRCNADEGHLVIFDRDKRLWRDKAFRSDEIVNGTPVHVWGV